MLSKLLKNLSILVIVFSVSFWVNYEILLGKKESEAEENAKAINAILAANFEQTEKALIFIGKQIAKKTPDLNLEIIHKIFVQASYSQGYGDIFSWSLFDWVDDSNLQTVNTLNGVNKTNPPDMSDRLYTLRGGDSWVLLFSKPVFGNPSNIYVIPVGVQIETKKYPHAGTVVVGINIKKLVNFIVPRLTKTSRFIVVDRRNEKLVFGSYELENNPQTMISNLSLAHQENRYLASKYMEEKYPYIIKTGYDEKEFWKEVVASSLILSLQIIGAALVVMMLKKKV